MSKYSFSLNMFPKFNSSISICFRIIDDLVDSETSTPKTPTAPTALDSNQMIHGDSDEYQINRKVYTREEFLHGTAGMGGPNLAMRIR